MSIAPPNYTQTPNILFDLLMKDMSEAELKVTLAAIRKTFGFHKDKDAISVSQFQELTGLSRQSVITGIAAGVERGTLVNVGAGKRGVSIYKINVSIANDEAPPCDQSKILTSDNVDQSKILTRTSQEFRPELVKNLDSQKKEKETSKEKDSAPESADKPSQPKQSKTPSPRKAKPLTEWDEVLRDIWATSAPGYLTNLKSMLFGTAKRGTWGQCAFDPPVTDVNELRRFKAYARRRMAERGIQDMPTTAVTIQRWYYDFRDAEKRLNAKPGYVPVAQRTSPLQGIEIVEPDAGAPETEAA